MECKFDIRGNLYPSILTEMTIGDFEENFVLDFEETSSRHIIFKEYLRYIEDLKALISVPFFQWVDGSFIGNRTNPKDIDFVNFIDYKTYFSKERELDGRFGKWKVRKFYSNLDAYTMCAYPENHDFHNVFLSDLAYWRSWFGNTAFNRSKMYFPKGFVQLNFS